MTKVNTVLGPISPDQMGTTLMHEHLLWAKNGWSFDPFAKKYEFGELVDACAKALADAKDHGVKTILNPSPIDNGRDVDLQKAVSEKTGLNMICATGIFNEKRGLSAYLKFRSQFTDIVSELYDTYMHEITVGIGKTGVKAGVIKVATGAGTISPYEEKVLKAAAKAQKDTGVPITTHTTDGTMGVEQADLLISEGADPRKIIIGHMDLSSNIDYQMSVLDKGVYIGFDGWGVEYYQPDKMRKAMIVGLLSLGFADRIVLSQDCKAVTMGRPLEFPKQIQSLIANWSFSHILKNIVPQLNQVGISDDLINQMLVGNPKNIFLG